MATLMKYTCKPVTDSQLSLVPAATVSAARFVETNSTDTAHVQHVSTAGGKPIGVAMVGGTAAPGQPIVVATGGVLPVTAGGTITAGLVASDATGKVIQLTSAHEYCVGYAIMAGSSGDTVSIIYNPVPNTFAGVREYCLVVPITVVAATAEQDTGYDLPAGCVVRNVYIDVQTAETTGGAKTIDVGTLSTDSGDADGFLDGVSVSAAGTIKGTLLNTGQTLGALLRVDESGAGVLVPEPCTAPGSLSITYSLGSNDWVEFVGNIIIDLIDIE